MRLAAHAGWSAPQAAAAEVLRLTRGEPAPEVVFEASPAVLALVPTPPAADDPVAARLERVALVADARIDNIEEVRQALGAGPEQPLGGLLIQAYQAWGETFPDRLAGDFAIVLWDEGARRLLAARDRFGVRPLVYRSEAGRRIWVASRVEQVLATFDALPALDEQMVVEHLLWRQKSIDATFFRDVRRVPPGHVLTATSSGTELRRYWFPPSREQPDGPPPGRTECLAEFRRLFLQAVERRLRSPAPVFVHVSGGLDSSSIAVAADALLRAGKVPAPSLRGVSGTYPGLACDEQPFIDAVARRLGFPVERWDARQAEALDLLDPLLEAPGGHFSRIGGTKGDVVLAVKAGARVILSGTGGDQLTSVTGVVQDMIQARDWRGVFRELFLFAGATPAARLGRLRFVTASSAPAAVRGAAAWLRAPAPPGWLAGRLRPLARRLAMPARSALRFSSQVQRQRWEDITSQQVARAVEALERQVGRADLEFRFPFLDTDLVRFVLRLPHQHWPAPGRHARLHREALRELLPPEVAARHGKAEFTPALMNKVRRAGTAIEDLVENGPWACGAYVDRDRFRAFWRAVVREGDERAWLHWRQVWAVATLEAWMRGLLGYYRAH